jgi:anti-anti-sigma factor
MAHGVLRSDSRAPGLAPRTHLTPALDLETQAPLEINSKLLGKGLKLMKRHQMASVRSRNEDVATGNIAAQTRTAFGNNMTTRSASIEPSFGPTGVNIRTHTLVLTGGLDRRSAHALEVEIERLCEGGVTGITLDLRQLAYIDSIGVAVIAFRCGLCRRRGYDFAVIPGSRLIHRAFEQAGVTDLLPFQEVDAEDPRLPAHDWDELAGERSSVGVR